MLRIMTVINYYHPMRGGAENIAKSVVEESVAKGLVQNVLTVANHKILSLLMGNYTPKDEVSDNYTIYRFKFAKIFGKEKNGPLFQYITLFKYLYHLIRLRKDYDVIHAHTYYWPAAAAVIAGRIIRKPVVITGHNIIARLQNEVRDKTFPSFMISLLKKCDYYVAINKYIAKEAYEICSISQDRIKVIYNGIDTRMFRPVDSPEEKEEIRLQLGMSIDKIYIIYHGRLHKHKNVQLLLRSINNVKEAYSRNVCLLILGSGPMEPKLKKYVAESKLEHMVVFTGKTNDVSKYLRASDIYCLPSFNEGFSISLLEAMGSGLVCIASDIEGNKEAITDQFDGFLFDPNDIDELTNKLYEVICMIKENTCNSIQLNARKNVVDSYSISGMTNSYISLFKETVNS